MTTLTRALWVVGDVHGELSKLQGLLHGAGLVDEAGFWVGGVNVLVSVGDLVDRGPDGVGVVEYLMRLEHEAAAAGGRVYVLLGNHEPLLIGAYTFGSEWRDVRGRSFLERWRLNRGQTSDLQRLQPRHLEWLRKRPGVVRLGPYLFLHADTDAYLRYGRDLQSVNVALWNTLGSNDPIVLDALVRDLSERGVFMEEGGSSRALTMLATYGGERLVHGHTPISYVLSVEPQLVHSPLLYAEGTCLNVDGGLAYHRSAGFLVRLGKSGIDKIVKPKLDRTVGRPS
ncbi:metallophosphoesterase [Deinococcus yavapaiensis]|uniref:Calcineurin-like phosphoesterase family protein n=1 Tax=Deinococcus yavapaiensis KR-236 TaxID=694435 RepID=A0A318SAN9_9DEIO|nr:metallophosphoesterase [Deinococcus yavapaiensis]PYE53311.1 calcineurin-like phosphoesterase family protein [Deinococcus yavapaiensis KR-236]